MATPSNTTLRRPNDPPLLILTSLAAGPKHGHALAKDIEGFAGVHLGPGALYGAITRLEERGLIEPLPSDDRRRPYRITAAGSAALAAAVADLRRIADVGAGRLGLSLGVQRMRAGPDRFERLLRWYPPAWRDRYGDEFLALLEDELDGAAPTPGSGCRWPASGLRQRARSSGLVGRRWRPGTAPPVRRIGGPGRLGVAAPRRCRLRQGVRALLLGPAVHLAGARPGRLRRSGGAGRAVQRPCGLSGIGLALPATVRFLRDGGWPTVRRRVTLAAGRRHRARHRHVRPRDLGPPSRRPRAQRWRRRLFGGVPGVGRPGCHDPRARDRRGHRRGTPDHVERAGAASRGRPGRGGGGRSWPSSPRPPGCGGWPWPGVRPGSSPAHGPAAPVAGDGAAGADRGKSRPGHARRRLWGGRAPPGPCRPSDPGFWRPTDGATGDGPSD